MSFVPQDLPIWRYAAFTDRGVGGNPAGVVLDAEGLDDEARLATAAQVGYSETAFVESVPVGQFEEDLLGGPLHYMVRYFSPIAQVAFCGHATVATAVALAERSGPGSFVFHTLAGPVPVETSYGSDGMTASLTSPPTSTRPADVDELSATLRALGWRSEDLDPTYPAHICFAGNDHLVMAASSRERLADLDYDFPALASLMAQHKWTTLHLVYAERPDLFHARNPFPPGGVIEDPATGAAAAAFGGYLRALDLSPVPGRITILQGADMGQPCRLVVDLHADDDRVTVSGVASMIVERNR